MPDLLVIALLVIGPLGIWLLMRFLNKSAPKGGPTPPPGA
jgi:flagellar biogenesis protein FliO